MPIRSASVALLDCATESSSISSLNDTAKEGRENEKTEDKYTEVVLVVRGRDIPPILTAKVFVSSSAMGFSLVFSHGNLVQSRLSLVTQGLIDIKENKLFYVFVSNLGPTTMPLPNQMDIATHTDPTEEIVHIRHEYDNDKTDEESNVNTEAVTAEHYKPMESHETQMKWHEDVYTEDQERNTQEWKDKVDIGMEYEHPKPQIFDMVSK